MKAAVTLSETQDELTDTQIINSQGNEGQVCTITARTTNVGKHAREVQPKGNRLSK